jgi:hypothetical protein
MGIELFSDLPTSVKCLSQNIKEMKPEFQENVLSNSFCYNDEFASVENS